MSLASDINRRAAISEIAPVAASSSKRVFDLLFALWAIVMFAPLLALIAIAIVVESPGPILFRQERTGLGGRPFTILKFRSMHVEHEACGEVLQARRGDQRVTAVGAVLRTLSLDELPQLLNVVAGDMSLVGPRPHAIVHDDLWRRATPNYDERFRARPGLTGLAQVNGHRGEIQSPDDLEARISDDLQYVLRWSFASDLVIIGRTIPLIFKDNHAY